MATFSPSGYYRIQVSGPMNSQLIVKTGFSDVPEVLVNDSIIDVFNVGDEVVIYNAYDPIQATVVGFTSDGILIKDSRNNHFLYTSNPDGYPPFSLLDINDNPFPVCFVKGTLIETDRGLVAIESLQVGDKVVGSTGLRSVKWIGWRNYHAISLRTVEQRIAAAPVRILAGALGDHEPTQDLCVSPWHHVFIDGVLVRANDLINGVSIVQDTYASSFSYYHVELDQFDVIKAHGVYSESWADGGNRDFFQNVDVTSLRPEDKKRRLADRPGFKVLRKAEDIARIHARVAARASTDFSLSKAA